jgi:hypothetical protein
MNEALAVGGHGTLGVLILAAAMLVATGCSSTTYAQTGVDVPSRSNDCQFTLLEAAPDRPYRELGVVEMKRGEKIAGLDRFEEAIRSDVCHAGGNAVVVMPPDDDGCYGAATVIALENPGQVVPVCCGP